MTRSMTGLLRFLCVIRYRFDGVVDVVVPGLSDQQLLNRLPTSEL